MNVPPPAMAVYVYCVAQAAAFETDDRPFESPAIGGSGEPVRTIRYEDLVAVVSDSPNIRYTLRREYLDAHQRVLGETLARSDVLPVAFGSMARDDRQVREVLLRDQFDDLHRYLEYVHGRVEMDLRVYWEQEQLFAEIVAENEPLRDMREQIAGQDPDATYFDRIRLGEMTEAAVQEKRDEEAERIMAALEPLAADAKVNPTQTDTMVLNAAFLVDRVREPELAGTVGELADAHTGRLILQYVGPLAPYNFVTLHVSWGR